MAKFNFKEFLAKKKKGVKAPVKKVVTKTKEKPLDAKAKGKITKQVAKQKGYDFSKAEKKLGVLKS